MALETVSTIYDLVATNPTAGDPVSQADDHLRNIKAGLLASFARSISTAGYQKVGGIIIQWGSINVVSTNTDTTFTLPIAFPNAALAVAPMPNTPGSVGGTLSLQDTMPKSAASTLIVRASVTGVYLLIAIGY